jgi:GDP-L-fucose synthase
MKDANPQKPALDHDSTIFVAGHRGLVGSAILRFMEATGHRNLITRSSAALDLTDQAAVREFFQKNSIEHVILAAGKVGGILANNTYPAEFIYQNLMIVANVIHEAYRSGVRRLLFLGSSCIYPKFAAQPMREEELLSGYLEATNEPYAVAKIAGIKLCQSYNRQYGTWYRSVMPTNLYGPNDNFDLENSHVLPALIRKFHLAKMAAHGNWPAIQQDEKIYGPIPEEIVEDLQHISAQRDTANSQQTAVRLWGTGKARREFLHVDDLASACYTVMALSDDDYERLCASSRQESPMASHINIGSGDDLPIVELSAIVKDTVGFQGHVFWDRSKADGTPRKLLDIGRLKQTGWQPRISLSEGIRTTYAWYLENTRIANL